ncbi:MAG: hypothetical protein FWB96_03430 [Defluviitaleaceae bacterium]|nr:hypothetical protein [Defluviitaleaceae bacterium]MCL2261731.1 hypothetical protein [Defluviitaleaceae bacterium]
MINNIGIGGSSYRPEWNRMDSSALNCREQEIFSQIKNRVASALGVPVKLYDGGPQETARGTRLFLNGFASSSGNSPFIISQEMLNALAQNEYDYREFMQGLEQSITNQIKNREAKRSTESYTAEREAERRSRQIKDELMSVLDFWNENSNDSWTHLGQGQAVQQKIIGNEN